jgi:hypothetical protein
MAVLDARASGLPASIVTLSDAQTGTGASTNVADRGFCHKGWEICRILTTIGATPTCTYALEVSADGSSFAAATYADIGTPTTDVATTFVVTTATTVQKIIKAASAWRYFRITYSANTNVTNTAYLLFSDARRLP